MSMDSYDYIMTGNSCENSQRIEKLEQLCRDLYHAAWEHKCFAPDEDNSGNCINPGQDCEHCQWWKPAFERRMTDLGLLDGEQND